MPIIIVLPTCWLQLLLQPIKQSMLKFTRQGTVTRIQY
jgi:hypothetical protein